jgi:transposase
MLAKVFQGTTNSALFEEFIEQLLPLCRRWPEPRSVLIMDNASIHYSSRVKRMCEEAGVILIYLPPYSPDLNQIEEFFAELKSFMKKHWSSFTDRSEEGFAAFLRWCVDQVGSRERSARGHFRHAAITVEDI